jgi:hypothetical protein
VQICNPLSTTRRDIKVANGGLNLRIDIFPIELRIKFNEVCRRSISELSIETGLLKLIIERICLTDIVWIAQLPYEISGSQQPIELILVFCLWHKVIGESSTFNCTRYALFVVRGISSLLPSSKGQHQELSTQSPRISTATKTICRRRCGSNSSAAAYNAGRGTLSNEGVGRAAALRRAWAYDL